MQRIDDANVSCSNYIEIYLAAVCHIIVDNGILLSHLQWDTYREYSCDVRTIWQLMYTHRCAHPRLI